MRASDYIGISEKIRSNEIKLEGELSEINSKISSLYNRIGSLESELQILQMELNAALSETDEDGNVDMGAVGAIRSRMNAVYSRISSCQSDISDQEREKKKAEAELQSLETEKQSTLSEIQSAATIKSQNISKLAGGMIGDYAGIGQNLQSAFQVSLGQLSQAASILGGSISTGIGGGFAGAGSSSGQTQPAPSGNIAAVGGTGCKNQASVNGLEMIMNPVSITAANNIMDMNSTLIAKELTPPPAGDKAPASQSVSSSASSHTFRDYLNPVNYDSNGHYTGDYRTPAIQTAQAVKDYNSWNDNGGIGLPSIDLLKNGGTIQTVVSAQNIFDVYDADNPEFWSYKSRPQSDYIKMATYVPLVRQYLESGKTISDIESMGGIVGACAANYFRNPVKVMKTGQAYIHCNDGRHRTIAAQIAKVEIPVCIVREFLPNSNNILSDKLKPVSVLAQKKDVTSEKNEEKKSFFDKFVNFAEKYGAAISALSAPISVVNGYNKGIEDFEKLKYTAQMINDISSSYVTETSDVSIPDKVLSKLGYVINGIGSDGDSALKSTEDIKKDTDEVMDAFISSENSPKTEEPLD